MNFPRLEKLNSIRGGLYIVSQPTKGRKILCFHRGTVARRNHYIQMQNVSKIFAFSGKNYILESCLIKIVAILVSAQSPKVCCYHAISNLLVKNIKEAIACGHVMIFIHFFKGDSYSTSEGTHAARKYDKEGYYALLHNRESDKYYTTIPWL